MTDTWFISDTHFGHKNILEFEKKHRPFETITEMHAVMIERWNSVVKPNDIVYHLGDFCFGKDYLHIAMMLNGSKRLVLGNHDNLPAASYLEYFDKIHGMIYWKECVLSHMPVHEQQLGSRTLLNVHGHLHSRNVKYQDAYDPRDGVKDLLLTSDDLNYFNVSCEQNNLIPIHRDVIEERIKLLQ